MVKIEKAAQGTSYAVFVCNEDFLNEEKKAK